MSSCVTVTSSSSGLSTGDLIFHSFYPNINTNQVIRFGVDTEIDTVLIFP